MPGIELFREQDLGVVADVLSLHPSLLATAYAVATVEGEIDYPIADLDALLAPFEGASSIRLGERKVTTAAAREHIRDDYFPIEGRRQLMSHLLRAFEHERLGVVAAIIREQGGRVLWEEVTDVDES
jgi:hypothetical protein